MEDQKADLKVIDDTLGKLQKSFRSHKTKSISYRKRQLKALKTGLNKMLPEITLALKLDLKRSAFVSEAFEFTPIVNEISGILSNLSKWSKDECVATPMYLSPGWSKIQYEPLGVTLIISSWNYPLFTSLKPLANAIAAGNMAIIKPSEMAPKCSNLIKKLVNDYLDKSAYQVIEGGVEIAKEIITKPFDLLIFTGSPEKGKIVASEAGKNLVPCILELGGKCPTIIDKSASLNYAAAKVNT